MDDTSHLLTLLGCLIACTLGMTFSHQTDFFYLFLLLFSVYLWFVCSELYYLFTEERDHDND